MATGLASGTATSIIAALANASNYTAPTAVWFKLHVGQPGSAATSNAATETTRKQATFASAAAGVAVTSADMTWTSVAGTETYTHFSVWTASTAGTFLWSGTVTANAVTSGDTFTLTAGQVSVSIPVAA